MISCSWIHLLVKKIKMRNDQKFSHNEDDEIESIRKLEKKDDTTDKTNNMVVAPAFFQEVANLI